MPSRDYGGQKNFLLDCHAPSCRERGKQCPKCHRKVCDKHMTTLWGETMCYVCRSEGLFGNPLRGLKQGETLRW